MLLRCGQQFSCFISIFTFILTFLSLVVAYVFSLYSQMERTFIAIKPDGVQRGLVKWNSKSCSFMMSLRATCEYNLQQCVFFPILWDVLFFRLQRLYLVLSGKGTSWWGLKYWFLRRSLHRSITMTLRKGPSSMACVNSSAPARLLQWLEMTQSLL